MDIEPAIVEGISFTIACCALMYLLNGYAL